MSNPTIQIIQNGSHANDGTGDTLRDATTKINDNFAVLFDLYEEFTACVEPRQIEDHYAKYDANMAIIFENGHTSTDLDLCDFPKTDYATAVNEEYLKLMGKSQRSRSVLV